MTAQVNWLQATTKTYQLHHLYYHEQTWEYWSLFSSKCVCVCMCAPAVLSLKETHYTHNTHSPLPSERI